MFMKVLKKALAGALAVVLAMPAVSMPAYAASLPDHIVNGSFSYPSIDWNNAVGIANGEAQWVYLLPDGRYVHDGNQNGWRVPGFSSSSFGWKSNQPAANGFPGGFVEMQRSRDGQIYAEMVAENGNYTIYQDISADGDSILYWSLKHAPRGASYTGGDTMQVLIGSPGRETVQRATRKTNNGSSDRVGETMTTIRTSKPNNTTFAPWEKYEGRYVVPGGGKQTIRFTFKAGVAGSTGRSGNLLDDIEFTRAYPVRFDFNGGTGTKYDPAANDYSGYFKSGAWVSISSLMAKSPTRDGYTFLGWSTSRMDPFTSKAQYDANRSRLVSGATTGNKTTMFYAVWGKNPTMTFNNQGSKYWSTSVSFGGTTGGPSNPTRPGYTFGGWTPAIPKNVYSNWETSAIWNPNAYKLTYVKNAPSGSTGGDSNVTLSKTSQTAKYDSPWGELATASKPGYTFLGWYTEPDGGIRITSDVIVRGDLTVYAHWAPVEYTIRFNGNGDKSGCDVTGSMPSIKVKYDQVVNLPANKFKATVTVPAEDTGGETMVKDSVFKGWNQNADSMRSSLADKASIMNLTSKGGAVVDLYAVWDNAPMFIVEQYPDRYFTLEEAQAGDITEEELLSTVIVKDRETNPLPHKTTEQVEAGDDVGVSIVGWDASEFTDMTDDGSVSIRYQVKDESGNTAYLNIKVTITGNGPLPAEEYSAYRAISDKYTNTLAPESRWLTDHTYQKALEDAFSGEAKTHSYTIDSGTLSDIREYVKTHGMGNSKDAGALDGLLGSFRD